MAAASLLKVANEKTIWGVSAIRKNAAAPAPASRTIAPAQLQSAGRNRMAQKQLTNRGGHQPCSPAAAATYRFGGRLKSNSAARRSSGHASRCHQPRTAVAVTAYAIGGWWSS